MSDLTYCYLHMSRPEIQGLSSLQPGREFIDGTLSDEGAYSIIPPALPPSPSLISQNLIFPPHMVPPNPDDADTLPSEIHPSYPYGNPLSLNHPASQPRVPYDFSSRALYEDLDTAYGLSTALRWKDLGLDSLLPADEVKEQQIKAAQARKMANGTQPSNTAGQPPANGADVPDDGDEDEEEEDDDDDEAFPPSQDGQSSEELEDEEDEDDDQDDDDGLF